MDYLGRYQHRILRGAKNVKELELQRKKIAYKKYLESSPTADYYQVTDVDEICISDTTKRCLVSITDVANNDKKALDEKNLYTFEDENIDIGCYLKYDNEEWLIVFKEHQPINSKMHFIMRKCNNYFRVKYKGKIYKLPVSIENLTMYSDGIADNLYLSFMDSKKQIWYGNNPLTRAITEGFRILLTHRTAFRITHINDFEYPGLIKSLVLQTAVINGDDIDLRLANNEDYYRNKYSVNNEDEPKEPMLKIIGSQSIISGEEVDYHINLPIDIPRVQWELEENKAFIIKAMSETNIVIAGSFNVKDIGKKTVLKALHPETKDVIDKVTLSLWR
jgi:hypothetical protein